jgi:hypothetical protein
MRVVFACLLLAAAPVRGQQVEMAARASHDSDGLDQQVVTARTTHTSGWGLKVGALHFATGDQWRTDGQSISVGHQQKMSDTRWDLQGGIMRLASRDHAVGSIDVMQHAGRSSLGVSAERDIVDSRPAIEAGLTFHSLAFVGDHSFGPRFNVGFAAGGTWFSDDNDRPFLRTRWNAVLDDDIGLNAYLKTRTYRNSRPHRPEYFSPERLDEASLGLSVRLAIAQRFVIASAIDRGQQVIREGSTQAIWSAVFGIESARNARVRWRASLQAANTAPQLAGSSRYRYTSAAAQLGVPF